MSTVTPVPVVPPPLLWTHPATLVEPVGRQRPDGDTFRLRLDLGTYAGNVKIDPIITIRLAGIDVVELSSPRGVEARDFAFGWMRAADELRVATDRPDPAGTLARTPARVWTRRGDSWDDLALVLRAAGFAKDVERLG